MAKKEKRRIGDIVADNLRELGASFITASTENIITRRGTKDAFDVGISQALIGKALVDVGVIMTLARRIEEAALKAGYK